MVKKTQKIPSGYELNKDREVWNPVTGQVLEDDGKTVRRKGAA